MMYLTVEQWRFYVGARGAQAPQILPRPPKFLDIVVLLLVELIGSIVISLKFRLAVVASQMMRGQPHPPNIFPRTAPAVEVPESGGIRLNSSPACTV